MKEGEINVDCKQNASECEEYLSQGYIKLNEFKLVDSKAFVDRFTNDVCTESFDDLGIIRKVALYAVNLPSSERKDPLKHSSSDYEENNFVVSNLHVFLIIIGITAAISNFHLFCKAIQLVKRQHYSHIVMAVLFGAMFLFCGLELSITTFVFSFLEVYVDKKDTPNLHQILLTVTETRRRAVGAITSISLVFCAIDRVIHFNNISNASQRKLALRRNSKVFLAAVIATLADCFVMSFLESWWRSHKRHVTDPKDENLIYYSSYKIFDDGKNSFNFLRVMDVFDAMMPLTFIMTVATCLSIYSVIGYKLIQLARFISPGQSNLRKIVRKSLYTIAVNLMVVFTYFICWFPYAILSRLSEMVTNCNRSYFTVILMKFEPGSFGWEATTIIYSLSGVLFYLFAVFNSIIFVIAHRQYRRINCCQNVEVNYSSKVEVFVPMTNAASDVAAEQQTHQLEETILI